jgi:hypothetical protein
LAEEELGDALHNPTLVDHNDAEETGEKRHKDEEDESTGNWAAE